MKYEGLGDFLRSASAKELTLHLHEIESLVGPLPAEAKTHQFWANAVDHHQSRRGQWLDNGYDAFFQSETSSVRFVRRKESAANQLWSVEELDACVEAYFQMLRIQERGGEINKTEWRRRTLPRLSSRSDGSYEFRMQNISSVLNELGLPILSGYLPRKNVGNAKFEIVRLINRYWSRDGVERPTDEPDEFETRVMSARQILSNKSSAVPAGRVHPQRNVRAGEVFARDPNIVAWVLNCCLGKCEMCDNPAPFVRSNGEPYLEVHHLRPLSEGGPDTADNALAVCPNCHRHLHHGKERANLRRKALAKIGRLVDYPVLKQS